MKPNPIMPPYAHRHTPRHAKISRRGFVKLLGAGSAAALAGFPAIGRAIHKGQVAVIGGGYGGATVAKYLRLADPAIGVSLFERNKAFISCPGSNLVLGGEKTVRDISFGYDTLALRYGISVAHDEVTEIDPVRLSVTTANGMWQTYDRIVVAPGIDFRWEEMDGYDETVAARLPHAWETGDQVLLLRRQLRELRDGEVVLVSVPPMPFRCPAAPYERASQIAYYLRQEKPASKVIILDANDGFYKQALFEQGWKRHYPGMITRVPASRGGGVVRVDGATRTLFTGSGSYRGAVINLIPPPAGRHDRPTNGAGRRIGLVSGGPTNVRVHLASRDTRDRGCLPGGGAAEVRLHGQFHGQDLRRRGRRLDQR
uniref:Sulfide dehydrogenase [flavocytochrome c] flavoprotein chain n=1 Tax=Candidatus Kentrum sp. FM TaxID=2126340 RepID=A0A450WDP4_9GAMM|nr:MAG: sulfide dehydrogenase [flavocytochrome c] flavoprotein chain [Candidatus Kentron sp. FM]VFJ64533.1 MAG: sulfide dehydrogenase [flavocytochrome c] flavoprotein chain [Candidatus Kentron sp. FM]VFK15150.1 MAG: sulfide dehydrogenase [flavocytochrome c] flavoprotein chain [Candidatus Kentron sp. FM]